MSKDIMSLDKAIKVLEDHNAWRRYNGRMDKSPEMGCVKELGIAIDLAVSVMERMRGKLDGIQ